MVHIRGRTMFIKSAKALAYAKSFKQQVESEAKVCFHGDVAVHIRIYYASRRPDLDESLILDLLQDVAYENDRQVKERHTYWHLDKERPRAEILVSRIEEIAPKKKPRQHRGKVGTARP